MQYLTYVEYQAIGGTLDLTAFNRYIDRADGIIDNATFSRIAAMSAIPTEAKNLCRDLVEYLAGNVSRETIVTSRSQSAGSVSESESYSQKSQEDRQADIDTMIFDYLGRVKDDKGEMLLYRGG